MQKTYNCSYIIPIGCYMLKPLSVLPHILAWFQCGLVKPHPINLKHLGVYTILRSDRSAQSISVWIHCYKQLPDSPNICIYLGSKWDSGNSWRLNISVAIKLNCVDAIWLRNSPDSKMEGPPREGSMSFNKSDIFWCS